MPDAQIRIPTDPPPGVGLYDLDGTLLAWDCQLLFRHFVTRREPWRLLLLPVFLLVVLLAPWLGTDRMKRVFLSYLWRMPEERVAEHARGFAAEVLPSIYPELLETIEEHRRAGHFLILASASPEIYVREIGAALGFGISLGTPVTYGPMLPPLSNHKGPAKVERLRKLLPPGWLDGDRISRCHGYTDSLADLPMLTLCDDATVVNPSPQLETMAEKEGWRIVRPERPWKSRSDFALRSLALLCGIGSDPGGLRARSGKSPA